MNDGPLGEAVGFVPTAFPVADRLLVPANNGGDARLREPERLARRE